jgi:signal transduction histidine kinase
MSRYNHCEAFLLPHGLHLCSGLAQLEEQLLYDMTTKKTILALVSNFVAQNPVGQYGVSLASVAIALWLAFLFESQFGNPFFGFFFPVAVICARWFCGSSAGWLATAASMVVVQYYFIPPLRSFAITWHDLPFSLTFLGCQVFAGWVVAKRKQAEDSLRQANASLAEQMAQRERAEESLRSTRAELARVGRLTTVGELTASIAHEINQPLAAVVTNADACIAWLDPENLNLPEARATAERAALGATRASEVIRRIRALISNSPIEKAPLQPNNLIAEVVELISYQAETCGVTVRQRLQPGLRQVQGDRIQLQQVILNLLTNAIEATSTINDRPRQVTIQTRELTSGDVQVSVADTGIGISEEMMAKLFEPFFTTRSDGIGMGLSISRSIVEAHGGRIWAESSPGQGSEFNITIPSSAEHLI